MASPRQPSSRIESMHYAISRLAAMNAKAGMSIISSYNNDLLFIFLITFSHKFCLDVYADGSVVKEKPRALISQSEPSVISLQLANLLSFIFPQRIINLEVVCSI